MTRSDTSTLSQVVRGYLILSGGVSVRHVAAAPGDEPDNPAAVEAPAESHGRSLRLIEAAGQASMTPSRYDRFVAAMADDPMPVGRFVGDSVGRMVRAGRGSEAELRDPNERYAPPIFETHSQAKMRPTVPPDRPPMIGSPLPKARGVGTGDMA